MSAVQDKAQTRAQARATTPPREAAVSRAQLARFALPGVLVLFVIGFSIALPDTFATAKSFQSIMANNAVVALVAVAFVLPLTVKEFDLSVGANLGLAAILCTGLPSKYGVPMVPAVIIALVATTAIGAFNGYLVARVGLSSIIVTLAVATILAGGVLWFTAGGTIFEGVPHSLVSLTSGSVFGIPVAFVYMAIIVLVVWHVLEHMPTGRYFYAIGDNKEASALAGLNVRRLSILAFVASGLIAGLAGVMQASLLGSGSPTVGPSFLLPGVAAAFLGATAIRIGKFNAIGAVVGVYTLAVGVTGIQLAGVAFYVAPIFQGVALLVAIVLVRFLSRTPV